MKLAINQAAEILSKTNDEVMFIVQSGGLTASVNEENITWEFDLQEVLTLKANMESETDEQE